MGDTNFNKELIELDEISDKLAKAFENIGQYHQDTGGNNYIDMVALEAKYIKKFLIFLGVLTTINFFLEVSHLIEILLQLSLTSK